MSEQFGSEGQVILPVYLVVDTSASLAGEIDSINEAVAAFFRSLLLNPSMADIVRVGLIAFSGDARIIKPLSLVGDGRSAPRLVTGGTTNYSAAFTLVREVIPSDVASLKVRGLRVFRPVMLFLTDGAPADPLWQTALDELRKPEFRERPTIVAIGFGSADPAIIREIGSGNGGAFMISDAISVGEAIASIGSALPSMVQATLLSSRSPSHASSGSIPAHWMELG